MPGLTGHGGQTGEAGWFGKIASLGDFSSRRLPQDFVTRCDDWLSRGISVSRSQLGEHWLNTYLTAPIWRFAWSPGLAGPTWWVGVMMPSVDNVGRYFPLVIAQPFSHPPVHDPAHAAMQHWLDHVAHAAMSTLQAGVNVDTFESQLMAAPVWDPGLPDSGPALRRLVGRDRYESHQSTPLSPWLRGVAQQSLQHSLHGQSLWWLAQNAHGGSSLSVATGLPSAEQFIELLQGSW